MKKVKYSEIMGSKNNIICVDDKYEFSLSHIEGSVCVPFDNLIANYRNILNKNEKYYIYCKSGVKSKKAVTILEYLGYDVVVLIK